MERTLLDWLVERYPTAKRETLRRMAREGRVTVDGRPAVRVGDALPASAVVRVDERPAARRVPKPAAALPFGIVFEDADLLVVDKPPGLLTSTVPRERRPTLLAIVRDYVAAREPQARVGLIHRLDRDASGLLVFSKSDAAYRSLKTQFFQHSVERMYLAQVHGIPTPPAGRIESYLIERADGTVRSTRQHGKGQRAITDYAVVRKQGKKASLLRVTLLTGRKHQIRVHLADRGTPIVGDTVYRRDGDDDADDAGHPMRLMAVRLSVAHPRTGQRMTWELPEPAW